MKRNKPLQFVIADSSGLISLRSHSDKNHHIAMQVIAQSESLHKAFSIIVPNDVFTETINVLGKKFSHAQAIDAGKDLISSSNFVILESSSNLCQLAFEKFQEQPSSVSFTDCLVMAFADFFETKEIFGFDRVFQKNNYVLPSQKKARKAA